MESSSNSTSTPTHPVPQVVLDDTPDTFRTPTPALVRRDRGKNFSTEEDKALAKAWIEITHDPIVGRSQTQDDFWIRVLDVYNTLAPNGTERNMPSLRNRWLILSRNVKKFMSHLRFVESNPLSGTNDSDAIAYARRLYQEKAGKPFNDMDVYLLLKDVEMFKVTARGSDSSKIQHPRLGNASPLRKSSSDSLAVSTSEYSASDTSAERPGGIKRSRSQVAQSEATGRYLKIKAEHIEEQTEQNKKKIELMIKAEERKEKEADYRQKEEEFLQKEEEWREREEVRRDKEMKLKEEELKLAERDLMGREKERYYQMLLQTLQNLEGGPKPDSEDDRKQHDERIKKIKEEMYLAIINK